MSAPRLLVIDDQAPIRDLIQQVGEESGFEVQAASEGNEFKQLYGSFDPQVITLDLQMPEQDGVELLRFLALENCRAKVVLATGFDPRVASTVREMGQTVGLNMGCVLRKPFEVAELRNAICESLDTGPPIVEGELKKAIAARDLEVFYQPKVTLKDANNWTIEGVEALIRWRHREHGLLLPGKFIPLAEETGLIGALTDFVLAEVIDQIKKWQARGLTLTSSVNYAPQLLCDVTLPDQIANALKMADICPSRLTLEITESAVMADTTQTKEILSRLQLKGMGLSVDDFGTGFSSLVELYRLPFSELKVDRSFVQDLDNADKVDEAKIIIRSIVDLAHNLGLEVCAEGVETEESLAFLRSLGCEQAQGFLIARPLPPDKVYELATGAKSTQLKSAANTYERANQLIRRASKSTNTGNRLIH